MSRYTISLLIVLVFCCIGNSFGQSKRADSLEVVLKSHSTDDTLKVNLLNQIAFLLFKTDSSKANSYLAQANQLSDKLKYSKGKAQSIGTIAFSLAFYKSYKLAIHYFLEAAKIAEDNNLKSEALKYLIPAGFSYSAIGNIPSAMECYEKAKGIAEEINSKPDIAKCLVNLSVIYTGQGNYDLALEGYKKVIEICEVTGDQRALSMAFNNIGNINEYKGDYPKALEYFHKSLKINEERDDKPSILNSFNNIGSVNTSLGNYEEALGYLNKALKMAEELNDKRRIAECYECIGEVYSKTNTSHALEYLQKALAIGEGLSYTTLVLNVSRKIGEYYRVRGNSMKALEYYRKALILSEEMNRKRVICEIWYKIGLIHFSQKEYSKALSNTENALKIANEMKLLSFQRDIHSQLAEIYATTHDYANAYKSHQLFKILNDSIYKEENIKKMVELEYTYKFEKEKQAIELEQQKKDAMQLVESKQQRLVIVSLVGGFLLMFLLASFIYSSYRIKHRANIALTRQNHEIEAKNEELLQLNEEISAQKDEISAKNAEIEKQNVTLHEYNATKDRFFSIIAHDLRNAFTSILGFSNLLADSLSNFSKEDTISFCMKMNAAAQNAYKLLENLLEWSRAQTGKIEFTPNELVLKNIVLENIRLCENQANTKSISISCQIPDKFAVHADRNMLNTILRNLISNAIKFTHRGGSISISALQHDGFHVITVSDTGIGMSESTRNKLFKINEKTSIPGTEKEMGTGIGLILCKEFVQRHGGVIWVESEPGKGSDFKFTIPATPAA